MRAALASLPKIEYVHSFRPGTVYTHWYIWGFIVAGVFGTVVGDKAQRFFMVRDEKAAAKTGWLALALFVTSPILFGIPPLIGKVLWPEIAQLASFAGASKPDESIFIAVVLKFLPAGIVGLFIAAMVAASMSALDSVWNTVSAIVSVDLYKGHLRPKATEKELLIVGRTSVGVLAVAAVSMALVIVHSSLGIFTISNIVLGLVGIPVTIPLLIGLVSRVPVSWSAIPAILSGIIVASLARFGLNWTLGPQYLAVISTCLVVMFTSRWFGRMFIKNRAMAFVAAAGLWIIAALALSLLNVPTMEAGVSLQVLPAGATGIKALIWSTVGLVLITSIFIPLYSQNVRAESPHVQRFFDKLKTPVDVKAEVPEGPGINRPHRIIGWSATSLAAVPALLLLIYKLANWPLYLSLMVILLALGQAFLYLSHD